MTAAQSVAKGRKLMQIIIKPEAADASTQTSWTEPSSSAAASTTPPSTAPPAPLPAVTRRRKARSAQMASDYSERECDCENCKVPEGEQRGLESIMPLAAPPVTETADGQVPTSSGVDASAGAEQSDWQRVGELPQVYGAPSSESSGSDDYDGMTCENDGCRNYVCDWSYPECASCWYEH